MSWGALGVLLLHRAELALPDEQLDQVAELLTADELTGIEQMAARAGQAARRELERRAGFRQADGPPPEPGP